MGLLCDQPLGVPRPSRLVGTRDFGWSEGRVFGCIERFVRRAHMFVEQRRATRRPARDGDRLVAEITSPVEVVGVGLGVGRVGAVPPLPPPPPRAPPPLPVPPDGGAI